MLFFFKAYNQTSRYLMPLVSTRTVVRNSGSRELFSQRSRIGFAWVLVNCFLFLLASSENALIKKKNFRAEKRLLENTYWLTSKCNWQRLNALCRWCDVRKQYRYRCYNYPLTWNESVQIWNYSSTKFVNLSSSLQWRSLFWRHSLTQDHF